MFVQGQDVIESSSIYLYVDTLVEELCQEVTILVHALGAGGTTQIANITFLLISVFASIFCLVLISFMHCCLKAH